MSFRLRLISMRIKMGLSCQEVADMCQIWYVALDEIERGRREPTDAEREALEEALPGLVIGDKVDE